MVATRDAALKAFSWASRPMPRGAGHGPNGCFLAFPLEDAAQADETVAAAALMAFEGSAVVGVPIDWRVICRPTHPSRIVKVKQAVVRSADSLD